jgi:hypothetical protein
MRAAFALHASAWITYFRRAPGGAGSRYERALNTAADLTVTPRPISCGTQKASVAAGQTVMPHDSLIRRPAQYE